MGVYINMEMPKNCWDCPLINTSPCACKGYSTALEHTTNRHPNCPLVPVPPHGRLIDADAIGWSYIYIRDDGMKIYTQRAIDNAPTVIEAEEGE